MKYRYSCIILDYSLSYYKKAIILFEYAALCDPSVMSSVIEICTQMIPQHVINSRVITNTICMPIFFKTATA